jgi:hypothetical protein
MNPEDAIKAMSVLWGTKFTLDTPLVHSGGADAAENLFGSLGTPRVATPPEPEPINTTTTTIASTSKEKPRSKATSVSPTIRKKPVPRPHGIPSTTPRPNQAISSDDDDLPPGGDNAWEDPSGVFNLDSDEDSDAPARSNKSRKAPIGRRSRALARILTPREKEARRQEREDARLKRDELRQEREREREYNQVSSNRLAHQSNRGKALDMLDGMIPLGLGAAPTHFRRQNVATNAAGKAAPPVPVALDVDVRSYLNQPKDAERAPHEILHDRVLALQRATSAPGAIGVLEMRHVLKDPKWLPYERQRDLKNKVSTKGMDQESRKAHNRMLSNQAAAFARAASEQREARLQAARAAFCATECEVPKSFTGAAAMIRSPLGAVY